MMFYAIGVFIMVWVAFAMSAYIVILCIHLSAGGCSITTIEFTEIVACSVARKRILEIDAAARLGALLTERYGDPPMSKEIGPREKALREMREDRIARAKLMVELVPLPEEAQTPIPPRQSTRPRRSAASHGRAKAKK